MKAQFYWPMMRIIHVTFGILNVSFLNCFFEAIIAHVNNNSIAAAAVVVFIHGKIAQIFCIFLSAEHVDGHFFAHFLMIDFQLMTVVFSCK